MESLLLNTQVLFRAVLRMSLSAGILTLAVIILRFVLRKAPKWICCLLWALVAVRLLCPALPESRSSVMPQARTYAVSEQRLIAAVDESLPALEWETLRDREMNEEYGAAQNVRVSTVAAPSAYLPLVWAFGVLGMLLYALGSYLRLRRRTAASAPFRKDVLLCDDIGSPFILGIFRPRIYIPSRMEKQQLSFVLAHEQAHLRRRDHWWKPLGFLLLAVHWFNPLLWLAYVLLCRDIELACDEKAVRELDAPARADYSQALLDLSRPRGIAACPLAFGETGVKQRVKSVLNYKKPAFWVVAAAVAACILAALCFLTEPAAILPEDGPIVSAEYASVGDNVLLSPEAWSALTELIEESRGSRFPARTDPLSLLSASVTLRYSDGSYVLVHYQYYSGFDLLRGREDDYRTVVTRFDASGKARKAWRMENAFDEAFWDWRSRWIQREENALDWLWKRYEVKEVLYDNGRGEAWAEVGRCAIGENYELLVSAGEDSSQWQVVGRLEPFTPEKDSFDGRHGFYRAYTSAAALRKQNRMAWRAVSASGAEDGGARFYDLLYQKNGDCLLAMGRYDAGEAGNPESDDSRVDRILRLAGTLEHPAKEVPDMEALREKYPEYFDLSAFKGLELYVWQMGPGDLRCGLMAGTNRNKTNEEIWSLRGATVEEMKAILAAYDVPEENISILPFLHPVSSYIYEINEDYRAWLRELFFGSAAVAAAPQFVSSEAPVLTVTCGGTSIVPYLHGRNALTWDGSGWLAADGIPVESDIREHEDEIPVLVLEGELTLTLGENVRRSAPMLQVYDTELTQLLRQDEKSLDALYELEPGEYFCTVGVYQRGAYISSEEQCEGAGYDGVFRLWVPETKGEEE